MISVECKIDKDRWHLEIRMFDEIEWMIRGPVVGPTKDASFKLNVQLLH